MYRVLGISTMTESAAVYIVDGVVKYAIEEERFSWRVRVRDVEVQKNGRIWVIEDGSDARLIKFSSPD